MRSASQRWAAHDVVYVATESDNVYAFDPAAGAALWVKNLGAAYPLNPSPTDTQPVPPPYNVSCLDMTPETGITSTPVIDVAKGRMYVVAKSNDGDSGLNGTVHMRIHALDVKTGADLLGGPVEIQGSVTGTGAGADAGTVAFQARYHLNRPGLLLHNGVVYIAFSSHCDNSPYHGWVFAYDAETLAAMGTFNATANGSAGGIWQSGLGPSASADGVFVVTGNGSFDSTGNGAMTGLSAIKLAQSGTTLTMADFWTPQNASALNVQTGVLWATSATTATADAWHKLVPGMLQAYDATTLVRVWTSTAKAADALGTFAKFNAPVVVGGRVYVGTNSSSLQVYGLTP